MYTIYGRVTANKLARLLTLTVRLLRFVCAVTAYVEQAPRAQCWPAVRVAVKHRSTRPDDRASECSTSIMRFIAALCLVVPAVVHALPQHNIVEANTTVHSVVGNSAPLHVHFCTDIVDCDSWAAARPGGVSVQMPQGCREAPVPGSVQAIAVVFTNASTQTAHRSAKRAEGDLLLACAENAEGQGEIAQFRRVPSLPIIAADELNSTDCVLLALTGSAGERHTKLKGLYQELKMCGYDALAPPGKIGPMKPVGRLNKLPEKDEIIQMITEENYMRELRKLSGADPIELPGGEEFTIRTRNTYSDTNLIAAEHMARFFQQCGLQDVQLQDFVCCASPARRPPQINTERRTFSAFWSFRFALAVF